MKKVMYWKEGFHDSPIDGATEITTDYWRELIDGQSQGKRIVSDAKGYPMLVIGPQTVEEWRERVVAAIEAHDKGPAVNSFTVGGISMWLDRETRAGLERAIATDETLGREMTSIWYEGSPPIEFKLPVEMAKGMLLQLEAYAKEAFNRTQSHKAAVYALGTAREIEAYDYTAGYPDKLEFNL